MHCTTAAPKAGLLTGASAGPWRIPSASAPPHAPPFCTYLCHADVAELTKPLQQGQAAQPAQPEHELGQRLRIQYVEYEEDLRNRGPAAREEASGPWENLVKKIFKNFF